MPSTEYQTSVVPLGSAAVAPAITQILWSKTKILW